MMGLFTAASCSFWACDDDDDWGKVDGAAPVVNLTTEHVKSAVGRTFAITGNIEDNDGISTIKLYCPDLYLNKTIDIIDIYDEPKKSYSLNYSFPISKEEKGDNFQLTVTVTDICGQEVSKTVLLTMDGDFELPSFTSAPSEEVTIIMKSRTSYNLNITVSDDQGLDYITVQIPGHEDLGETKTIQCNGGKKFEYSEKILFPNVETSYQLLLSVVDKEGKKTEKKSNIVISSKVPDYPNLWLADVATSAELNADIFGVPEYVGHAYDADGNPIPFTYEARYYNQKAGTKVKFLGQKNDFSPVCYGVDAADTNLLSDDEETMKDIVLNEAGVYYKLTFNIKNYELQTETYPVSEAIAAFRTDLYGQDAFDVWGDGGSWLYKFTLGYLSGGPADVISFAQDSNNPNLFYLEEPLTFDAENNTRHDSDKDIYTTNFMIHNFHPGGWWDVVCYKPSKNDDPEFWPWWGNNSQLTTDGWHEWPGYSGTPNDWCKVPLAPSQFGDYKLIFDAHLERAKLVPVK